MRGNETDWVNDAEKRPGDNESQIAVDQRQVSAEVVEQQRHWKLPITQRSRKIGVRQKASDSANFH